MFGRSIQFPGIGCLTRGWGKWHGQLTIRQLVLPLKVSIAIPRQEPVEPFAKQAVLLATTFGQLQEEFGKELFESYQFYRKIDLDHRVFTEDDYAKHPAVESFREVWRVLTPYLLWLGRSSDEGFGNAYLLINVDWPNPHFFQVFMNATSSGFEYVHTGFVG